MQPETFSVLKNYGEDLTSKVYLTDPAIARDEEIKKLMMILLTPEKSAILVGKAGIGKTYIVEGLAYRILKRTVPPVLQGYRVIKINSSSLLGKVTFGTREELVITLLVEELKKVQKTILFIDEIHTLIGTNSGNSVSMDLANILKPAIDRGAIKLIGATTDIEYDTYIIRDRAFLRRFERIDVSEPTEATTVEILFKSLPKIEALTGAKFKYNEYVTKMLLESIVSATSEYKRVYGLGAMYPDIAFSVLTAAFSNALVQSRTYVTVLDVYMAILNSKRIYPDSIVRELALFKEKYKDVCAQDGLILPDITAKKNKNYVILTILLITTVSLTMLFSKIYLNRTKEISNFYTNSNQIRNKEIEQFSMESPDVIYYISNKYNLENVEFESIFKSKLEEKNLLDKLVYIDIKKSIINKFKKIYKLDLDIDNYPIIVFVVDKKVVKAIYVNDDKDIDNFIDYEVYE